MKKASHMVEKKPGSQGLESAIKSTSAARFTNACPKPHTLEDAMNRIEPHPSGTSTPTECTRVALLLEYPLGKCAIGSF